VLIVCFVPLVVIAGCCARIKLAFTNGLAISSRAGRDKLYQVLLEQNGMESKDVSVKVTVSGREYTISLRYACCKDQDDTKPPLLFLPGSYASSAPFLAASAILSAHFRVYILDLPGWGVSDDLPFHKFSVEDLISCHVDVTQQFLQVMKLPKAVIAAHSLAGFFAVHHAHQYAAQVEQLILINPAGLLPLLGDSTAYWSFLFKTGVHNYLLRSLSFFILPALQGFSGMGESALFQTSLLCSRLSGVHILSKLISWNLTHTCWKVPCIDMLCSLTVETVLIYGSADTLLPVHQGCVASALTEGQLKCYGVADAGHGPHGAEPELFVRTLLHGIQNTTAPGKHYKRDAIGGVQLSRYHACFDCNFTRGLILDMYRTILNETCTFQELRGKYELDVRNMQGAHLKSEAVNRA